MTIHVIETDDATGVRREYVREMPPSPDYWRCRACGCLWRDNHDDSVSLAGAKQTSCERCEQQPTSMACDPLYTIPVGAVAPDLRALIAALRERTWLAPVSAEEMNHRDRWLADQLAAVGDRERRAALEDAAKIADAMALNPWGGSHDAITPGHVAEMIARAIRDKADDLAALLRSEPAE